MDNAIEIKGLVKKYKNFVAVNGIDLTVKQGELFALLGENGAGKTTTIKVLCSLTTFNEGEIFIDGKNLKTCSEEIKRVLNLSPQETAVAKNLTVKENLKMICGLYNIEDKEKVQEYINKFHLEKVANKRAKTLSGGYARRLSIAMALITDPKILFLDEPTLGLDVRARRELWKVIEELKGKMTIVLTTHYIEEAEALSDRIAIMKKGKVLVCDTAQNIKEQTNESNIDEAFLKIVGDDDE